MGIDAHDIAHALATAIGIAFPDPDELRRRAEEIGDDPGALRAVAVRMRAEAETRLVRTAVADHSQYGEFRILLDALVRRAAAPGIVVDVGARERRGSNSYDLISRFGWRGVLVEALPERAARLGEEFGEGDYRVYPCAVGLRGGTMPLWLGAGSIITSLVRSVAEESGGQGAFVDVEVRTLADILADAAVPHDFDLLTIDIEGLDVDVVNDLIVSTPWRPRWIVAETQHRLVRPLEELGFAPEVLAAYREIGRTLPNTILERA